MPGKPNKDDSKGSDSKPATNISSKKLYQFLNKNQQNALQIQSIPIDKGYGVKTPTKYPANANCRLAQKRGSKKELLDLYIVDFETQFEMAGETAQSKDTQQFFPSNFVQPAIQFTGIAPSDYEYNRLGNYVRQSHLSAVNGSSPAERIIALTLSNRNGGFPIEGQFPYKGGRAVGKEITKGRHISWRLYGYIQGVQAGARVQANGFVAPTYTFTFMVLATGENGLWNDRVVNGSTLEDWMSNFEGQTEGQKAKTFVNQREPAKKPSGGKTGDKDGKSILQILEETLGYVGDAFTE